jgi:hypothetical protein
MTHPKLLRTVLVIKLSGWFYDATLARDARWRMTPRRLTSDRTAWRGRVRLITLVAMGLICCFACGRAPSVGDIRAGATASAARTATPSAIAPVSAASPPAPTRLTSQNCSGIPPVTAPRTLGFRYTMRAPSGWTDTGDYRHTESLLLELTAPASYGNSPTRIQFHALPFDVHNDFGSSTTAHSIAADEAATHRHFTSPRSAATSVADCSVAGVPAAAFGYADSNERGYWLLFIHKDSLLAVRFFGIGGIGDQATKDALDMIGSIAWTV